MTRSHSPSTPQTFLTLSHWLALCAALVSFAIASDRLILTFLIGLGAIALKAIPKTTSKHLRIGAQFCFTLSAYILALLPLWPKSYSYFYYSPLLLILGVATIAALNRHSHGGSRGFTSIAAIAFLLFIRNIVLYFQFEPPIQELATSFAFVGLVEIALSRRFQKSEDHPHPELVFGLIIALIASFHFSSLPLAIVLTALPILAFLLRNHELARMANEHVRPANPLSPPPRSVKRGPALFALAGLPLLAAFLFYLTVLQLPFWGDLLPSEAPYLAKSIAQKTNTLSKASNLEDEAIVNTAHKLVNPEFIKKTATQIARNWQSNTPEIEEPNFTERASAHTSDNAGESDRQSTRSYDADQLESRLGPFNRDRITRFDLTPTPNNRGGIGNPFPGRSESRLNEDNQAIFDPSNPPTPEGLTSGMPGGIDTDFSNFAGMPPNEVTSKVSVGQPETTPSSESLAYLPPDAASPTEDFDRFLDAFEQPEKAITQALNLEGSDISALLSEEALAIVKLDSSREAPRRLYLRRNVLDTVDQNGLGGIRGERGSLELPLEDKATAPLRIFRQSKSSGSAITITSNQSRTPTLPLPESFGSIQLFEADTLKVYPEERVAITSRSQEPITYRVFEADLEITDREREEAKPSDDYRQRMLEIPLRKSDRSYLEKLAKRVGGSRSPTRQFAYRFANYFANRHPYSYFVSIPPGPGHSVVRWLENERPGLCSNYAAAFTLLARSRGIPARVVGGFASNEFDAKEKRYVMRQNNAHAWVEYLDESNRWIRFDPTPGISEAEIRRAEQYVSSGSPLSLQRLIAIQENATQEKKPTPEIESVIGTETQQTSSEIAETTPDNQTRPISSTGAAPPSSLASITSETSTSRDLAPERDAPAQNPEPIAPQPLPADPAREIVANDPELSQSEPPSPSFSNFDPEAIETNPPWLVLLAILAIVIPSLTYIMRFKKNSSTTSPEIHLRHKAGRLLAQLDELLKRHELTQDPIWIETRKTLSEQRYGRETNPIMVQDLAVKVGLLSKRKNKR